jgi:hypothetical protein
VQPRTSTLGAEFARAFAGKDSARMRELLHPEVDFKGLTPSRSWEASGADAVIDLLFGSWLEDTDKVEELEAVEDDAIADRDRVGYRCSVTNPDGRFVFEQQAYLSARDGQIGWMRVVCSGFRPVD